MKARIVRIGNSRGIRIPKPLLEQAGLREEVDLQVGDACIVIASSRKPRDGWADAARRMRAAGDDQLLDPPTLTRFDREEWAWR
jgi:antitoxin MazE